MKTHFYTAAKNGWFTIINVISWENIGGLPTKNRSKNHHKLGFNLFHTKVLEAGAEDTTRYAGQNQKKTNKNTLLNQGFMGIFHRI